MKGKALKKAIDIFGHQADLARALEVTPMAVTQWKRRGVPLGQAIKIEGLTGGSVTARELCPDKFPEVTPAA